MSERYKTQVFDELCESHPEIAAGEDWRGYYVDWDEIVKAAALDGNPVWDESPIELVYQLRNKIEEQQAEIERLKDTIERANEQYKALQRRGAELEADTLKNGGG